MSDFFGWLTSTDGFAPRIERGDWTPGMIWLYVGSDVFIWLAYLSIPLVLLYFVRRHRDLPFSGLFVLFATFILVCGLTYFVDALVFYHPVYRLAGVVKLLTAVVSWVTVLALVPAVPRVLEVMDAVRRDIPPDLRRRLLTRMPVRYRGYIVAILAAVLGLLVRRLLEPVLGETHPYIVAFPAVVFVAWEAGFGPAVLATVLSAAGVLLLILPARAEPVLRGFETQVGVGLFVFTGVGCALLGETQRHAHARAEMALADTQARRAELEAEVARREKTETALRESESRFRSMADSVPVMIWVSDENRQRTYFNKTWLEFTGRPVDEQLGEGWATSIHPDDHDLYLGAYHAAFAARRPFEVEYRLRRHDHAYRWVLARGTPRLSPEGTFAGFSGLCMDITDRKEAIEGLRASEERFRTLAETIPQLVWTATPGGSCDYLSRQWGEYTGLPTEQHLGAGWLAAVHPDDRVGLAEQWGAAVTGATEFDTEYRIRRYDGEYRWFKARAVPAHAGDGAVTKWVGTNTDIDDQKRESQTLEQIVRERTIELRRSNSELEQFAYVASHDLQEPLRKIQAFGDRLRDKNRDQLGDVGRDYLDRMLNSAGRMSKLIDDLLAYSRVTTQARPFIPTDLNYVLRDVLDDLDNRVERTGARVEAGPLPVIDADPTQMRQLFQNLIGNALKFAKPGVPPVVRIGGSLIPAEPGPDGQPGPPVCRLEVADNGIGFDEKYLDRIFQVFQRLHGRGEYEGTGVGLAICKKIADRHGGTITARSEPGRGATFVVFLAARHPAPPEAQDTTDRG